MMSTLSCLQCCKQWRRRCLLFAEILSPSLLDFPKLALSSVTPLNEDPYNKSSPSLGNSSDEDKAIAEKGFYLHPSPKSTPRDPEPQLLPLFPVTSPRVSGSS
ncbi:VQ motif-containing protein 19 [Hibiscus syriacus]|uniref:VQ motif-containing protein 19 n=1 Tax=Hibiscus syriacus TaxID=106335 RepID=A0A6A2XY62_HIBSY|nr:VQ motif-containing protein 19 [Hibiscus syriacus]